MREIPIFIASSVREFRQGRKEISEFLDMLNKVYKRMDAQLVWNRPETSPRVMNDGGSQLIFDDFIRKSEFFALIVGKSVGTYTRHEYEIALEQFRKTGKPKILPCFLADTSPEAQAFRAELQNAPIGVQFIDPYDNFDAVKNQLQFEIANYIVETAPQSDAETDFQRARERIRDKIRGLRAEIERLQDAPTSPETVAKITLNYAEIWRLVRDYKVEPDALLDYMGFLWKQHQYDTAIEVGRWLEGFYKMENPGDDKSANLNNYLGACYAENNQREEAERYYREALEINRRLAAENPAFKDDVAVNCYLLGILLSAMNRMKEAEDYYREALEILRSLAEKDSAYLPNAASICHNFGAFLRDANLMEKAETYHRKTLAHYRRLARKDPACLPDLAKSCNNFGYLLSDMNRIEEAEKFFREALEIYSLAGKDSAYLPNAAYAWLNLGSLLERTTRMEETETCYYEALEILRGLAEANPDAYSPDVAGTCYNLGKFELYKGKRDAARRYFEEALSIFEKFPHLEKVAQDCRDFLAALQDA